MEIPYYEGTPEVERMFNRHARKSDEQGVRFNYVMNDCKRLADTIIAQVPYSREREEAIRKLEEVQMWANKGLALHTK